MSDKARKSIEHGGLFHITCELMELDKLNKIPDRELPLHSINEFEFESVKKAFEKRLKGDDHGKEEKKII